MSEHISNILSSGELDGTSVGFSDKSSGGRKRYNGESCNEFFDNVVSSRNLLFNEIGKSVFKEHI